MLCIIKIINGEPGAWLIAADPQDARRQLPMGDEWQWLAEFLYRLDFLPKPGKYPLGGEFWMLVS